MHRHKKTDGWKTILQTAKEVLYQNLSQENSV